MVDKARQRQIRNDVIEYSKKILLGPGSENGVFEVEEEIISERPSERYLTGILYSNKELEQNKKRESSSQIGSEDDSAAIIDNSFYPKSFGLTFHIPNETSELQLKFSSAYYKNEKMQSLSFSDSEIIYIQNAYNNLVSLFPYLNIDFEKLHVSIDDNDITQFHKDYKYKVNSETWDFEDNQYLLRLLDKIYKYSKDGAYIRVPFSEDIKIPLNDFNSKYENTYSISEENSVKLTVFKRNLYKSELNPLSITIAVENIGEHDLYQSELEASTSSPFISTQDIKKSDNTLLTSYDDRQNELLYRNNKTYGIGHSISVAWDEENTPPKKIRTTYIPEYETTPMSFEIPVLESSGIFNANNYTDPENIDNFKKLNILIEQYELWIEVENLKILNLDEHLKETANINIDKCYKALKRMKKSIDLLLTDDKARKVFCLAHEAMILQRMKSIEQKESVYRSKDYNSETLIWRPFQLAFILNSFESTINEHSDSRDELDLIWVTTGGGKTEAYLFMIASTIFNRRLSKNKYNDGTTVIMRYTLRLLTAQQFERASSLIVACEFIRLNNPHLLGDKYISIGLWVGGDTTPNKKADADKNISEIDKEARDGVNPLSVSKFQIVKCPWCYEKDSIFKKNQRNKYKYGIRKSVKLNEYHNLHCLNSACTFNKYLPIHVVDDEIYKNKPTLLFGTVDKFAQVAHKIETKKLFGNDKDENLPPELIIQDELHLISGPLGSIVGLYESAFDFIIQNKHMKPKYIASTATIRNATEQTKSLFDRNIQQFPPSGLTADDNYFVYEDKNLPGRKYIGLMGTGKSMVTSEIRLISSLLLAVNNLDLSEEEKELYWTQAGYFNSIRELGKMTTLLDDDISSYLKLLHRRNSSKPRFINRKVELTSRIKSTKIRNTLDDLEIKYSSEKNKAIDVLTATNMLSVGIDISRLNSMFVVGQPKQTAEYIQATSRVGRSDLGLVLTLYNASRSRDRSHYETFQSYHSNLYKFVEPTSVTPFSVPALEKGLASIIILMLLHFDEKNADPNHIEPDELDVIKDFLFKRVINSDVEMLFTKDAKILIEEYMENISQLLTENNTLKYYLGDNTLSKGTLKYLLKNHNINGNNEAYTSMLSMRDIDQTAYLKIIEESD